MLSSIRRKIMGIALTLIILMVIAAALSMLSAIRIGYRLDDITQKYVPAYGSLARTNLRSVERALELRRMLIAKMQKASDEDIALIRKTFDEKGIEVERESGAAISLIGELIKDSGTSDNPAALIRLQDHLQGVMNDSRRYLNAEIARLFRDVDHGNQADINDSLARVDVLRNDLNEKLDAVRAEMLALLKSEADTAARRQYQATLIAALTTLFATILGLVFSVLVSDGVTRPVTRLLEGTRAVEAGKLDETIAITSTDEIGHLTAAFNRMVEQLRLKQRIYETFGKYIDPRVVEDLIDRPGIASEGRYRTMTILFCDIKGFSSSSEGLTPQGLVKVTNRYLSTMSEPIRARNGIIDKYIGDAIMAYWGPPFNDAGEHAKLATLAALDMIDRIVALNNDLPGQIGIRQLPTPFDMRIGVATGEVVVGSIGSEFMMSYTVMGDAVNLASRLEGANKVYGSKLLVSQETAEAVRDVVETREIDRVILPGQTKTQTIFDVIGRTGEPNTKKIELRARFAEGLAAYRGRRWDEAAGAFKAALHAGPNDGPSLAFIKRIEEFSARPPSADWDGSWHIEGK